MSSRDLDDPPSQSDTSGRSDPYDPTKEFDDSPALTDARRANDHGHALREWRREQERRETRRERDARTRFTDVEQQVRLATDHGIPEAAARNAIEQFTDLYEAADFAGRNYPAPSGRSTNELLDVPRVGRSRYDALADLSPLTGERFSFDGWSGKGHRRAKHNDGPTAGAYEFYHDAGDVTVRVEPDEHRSRWNLVSVGREDVYGRDEYVVESGTKTDALEAARRYMDRYPWTLDDEQTTPTAGGWDVEYNDSTGIGWVATRNRDFGEFEDPAGGKTRVRLKDEGDGKFLFKQRASVTHTPTTKDKAVEQALGHMERNPSDDPVATDENEEYSGSGGAEDNDSNSDMSDSNSDPYDPTKEWAEKENQASLTGGRADDQIRFDAPPEQQGDSEIESVDEVNDGGLFADTRENTGDEKPTEQGSLDVGAAARRDVDQDGLDSFEPVDDDTTDAALDDPAMSGSADPFDPTELFSDDVLDEMEASVEWQDVENPENVPKTERETEIDLAERILQAGGNRTGFTHHTDIQNSMGTWANEHDGSDADPGYWREMHYKLTPSERNRGRLEGDLNERYKKARTVIAWASDEIDTDVLREIEREQSDAATEAWLANAEAAASKKAAETFRDDPPAEHNGWERFESEKPGVVLAYRGDNSGTPSVAFVFESEDYDDGLGALEATLDEFEEAATGADVKMNRPISRYSGDTTVWEDLKSHLNTFSADPLDVDEDAADQEASDDRDPGERPGPNGETGHLGTGDDGPKDAPDELGVWTLNDTDAVDGGYRYHYATDSSSAKILPDGEGHRIVVDGPEDGPAVADGLELSEAFDFLREKADDADADDSPAPMGFGGYRQQAVERLDDTPHLEPIETFGSVDEMVAAIEEIHVPDYSKPPEKTIEKLRHYFGKLPSEQAEREYLNDYKLVRTVNAARRAFNDYVSRKKRYDQMPGWAEAGPSNYPVKKQNKLRDSADSAREKLDEKLDRLNGRTKGAFRRALKKVGTSEGEINEAEREETRQQRREEFEKGDLAIYQTTKGGYQLWGVKRVNKKSVRLRRPHELAGNQMPMSDDVYPEYDETTAQLDSSRLRGPIPDSEIDEIDIGELEGTRIDNVEMYESADRARLELFGEKWAKKHLELTPEDVDDDDGEAWDVEAAASEAKRREAIRTEGVDAEIRRDLYGAAAVDLANEHADAHVSPGGRYYADEHSSFDELDDELDDEGVLDALANQGDDDDEPADVEHFDGETRGRIKHHAGHGSFLTMLFSARIPDTVQRELRERFVPADQDPNDSLAGVRSFVEFDGEWTDVEGVGPATAADLEAMVELATDGLDEHADEPVDEPADDADDGPDLGSTTYLFLPATAGEYERSKLVPNEVVYKRDVDGGVEKVSGTMQKTVGGWSVDRVVREDGEIVTTERTGWPGHLTTARKMREALTEHVPLPDPASESDGEDVDVDDEPDASQRRGEKIEFGTLDDANEWRDEHPDALHPDDTRRTKTITLHPDVDADDADDAERASSTTFSDDKKKYGQQKLSDDERKTLENRGGWSWGTNGFEAMSAKAALIEEGAADWMNYYEAGEGVPGSLANLEAGKERTAEGGGGNAIRKDYIDSDPDRAEQSRMMEKAEGEACSRAVEGCEDGYEEACEELKDRCGYSQAEIDELREAIDKMGENADDVFDVGGTIYQPTEDTDGDDTPGLSFEEWAAKSEPDVERPDDAELARLAPTESDDPAVVEQELSGPALNTLRKAWGGYKLARREQRSAVDRAEKYAKIINGVRMVNGQDALSFEALDGFDGGEIVPDDPDESFPVADGRKKIGKVVQQTLGAFGEDAYDPMSEFAGGDD